MADYPGAIDYFVDRSRVFPNQNSHSAIVCHCTAGPSTWTAQQLGDYFRTTPEETSSHFGIDRAGVVCQYVSLVDGAAANCCKTTGYDPFWDQFGDNLNWHTISIEHVNDTTNSLALTPAQQDASNKLILWLCQQYGLTTAQIKGHASIDPVNRPRCPGPAFDFNQLFQYIGANMVNQNIVQAAQDTWNSTAFMFGGAPLNYNTGIANAWKNLYINQQHPMPAPTTPEFASVDWNGNPITVQLFATIRCEWSNGSAHWYNATGGIQ